MDVLGVEVEGDPWRILRMDWIVMEMEKEVEWALRNGELMKMKCRIGVMVWKMARGNVREW